ncbi:S8 family serine peptidase [bacterium]|nr:S8 family serine peptidase [bacterium]
MFIPASSRPRLPQYVEGEVLVKLKDQQPADQFVRQFGASLCECIPLHHQFKSSAKQHLLRLQLPAGMSTAEGIALMSQHQGVAYAATNDILEKTANLPKDLDQRLWGLHNSGQQGGKAGADISCANAWSQTTGSRNGPVVAVVDTGVDYQHTNLKENIWTNPQDGSHGFNAINGSHDPMDDDEHGTHCSGTIAAQGQQGVYGINWQAQVMPVKFLDSNGSGKTSDAIKGLAFAAEQGARITSNSWGGTSFNPALRDALANSPCLHIFAAGNDNSDNDAIPYYPAGYDLPNLIAVAASDRRDQRGMFSNYGAESVHLAAPGVDIYSTVPGDQYTSLDGTSMAAPHVAGAAALVATAYPEASNQQLKARLLYNVDQLPQWQGQVSSGGRLNVAAALHQDEVAPGAPLQASIQSRAGRVQLQWQCPGDDGQGGGAAAAYEVRYSDQPIVDDAGFETATAVKVERPGQPGTTQSVNVYLPLSEQPRKLYFAIKASDEVGNLSPMVTISDTVPAARFAFLDKKDASQWNLEGSWGLQNVPGRGPVWTDSPDSSYANELNTSLTSKPFALNQADARLIFEEKHLTELNYDRCSVEISRDGKRWDRLDEYTGNSAWKRREYDLSAYQGANIQFRFRLQTDNSGPRDGVFFDNIAVAS